MTYLDYAEQLQSDGSILVRAVKLYGPTHKLHTKKKMIAVSRVSSVFVRSLPERTWRRSIRKLLRDSINNKEKTA